MATTHSTPARNAVAAAVMGLLNQGSANAAGIMRFRTSGDAVVAACNLSNPAAAAPSNGVAGFNPISNDTNAVGGSVAKATVEDRDRNIVLTLSDIRTTSGGDLQGSTTTITAGDIVSVSALSYSAPP